MNQHDYRPALQVMGKLRDHDNFIIIYNVEENIITPYKLNVR